MIENSDRIFPVFHCSRVTRKSSHHVLAKKNGRMMLWRGMLLSRVAMAAVEDFLCWKDVMWIDVLNYVDHVAGFSVQLAP